MLQQSSPRSTPAGNVTTSINFPSAGVPQIVIGNKTITPTPNPIGLPVYNGTVISSSTGIVVSTDSNGNLTTGYTVVPFIGVGSSLTVADGWLLAWIVGAVGLGAGVYYL